MWEKMAKRAVSRNEACVWYLVIHLILGPYFLTHVTKRSSLVLTEIYNTDDISLSAIQTLRAKFWDGI